MSREIYTYTDLTSLARSENFAEIKGYPQITASSDLRKGLKGRFEHDRTKGIFTDDDQVLITDFHSFSNAIDSEMGTNESKFNEMVLLSEYIRKRYDGAENNPKEWNWLKGCLRNLGDILASIHLLEQAQMTPEDMGINGDRNLELLSGAWRYLRENDPVLERFHARMMELKDRKAWDKVLNLSFETAETSLVNTLVFHGFYNITPYQECIMKLLEQAGFSLIYLIPYDARYPFVYEIWEETYSEKHGYPPKSRWHMDHTEASDPYGEIFEGRQTGIHNMLQIREYHSVMEFADDIERIKKDGYTMYSADYRSANRILKDYFPEEYGDRKILAYPIGQFLDVLNRMWKEELQTITLEPEGLIDCFSSGWLAYKGVSGKAYMQDLMYMLTFFQGCRRMEEWEERIQLFREIQKDVLTAFDREKPQDAATERWQEIMGNPLKSFGAFAPEKEKTEVILALIEQIFAMAKELFGDKKRISIQEYIRKLDGVLKKNEVSNELYAEERKVVQEIFEQLGKNCEGKLNCSPSDISNALSLFLSGKFDDGEIDTKGVGLVSPLYFVDAACIKNKSKVHICMCDVDSLPGRNRPYPWPLSGKMIRACMEKTGNLLLENILEIMSTATLSNRYFIYCAMKNRQVQLSWISSINGKSMAPSSYLKLVEEAASVPMISLKKSALDFDYVMRMPKGKEKVKSYKRAQMPSLTAKEARMDYALCPWKYILGYLVEKQPVYQSEFQQTYALNPLISALNGVLKDRGITEDEVYEQVISLFPYLRRIEKRQVYDYMKYDRGATDMDFKKYSECGNREYSEQRLKIHFPEEMVRREAAIKYETMKGTYGRDGMDLYEKPGKSNRCASCPHVSYCRNAKYVGDEENHYDR